MTSMEIKKMKIAVLTGGGDCPGINAVIQAVVKRATEYGYEVLGVMDGYAGLLNGNLKQLSARDVADIFSTGGAIIRSSRTNPLKTRDDAERALKTLEKFGIDALIALGGDDTLGIVLRLSEMGVKTVGIPKTIDNNLAATDCCVGFHTAVETAADVISKLHTTAKSHNRVIVVEIMGRYEGWLALMAGLAGGAHVILIPEKPFDIKSICDVVERRDAEGKGYTIIALAEGAKPESVKDLVTISGEKDEFGNVRLGGIAVLLEKEIEKRTGKETRSMILGHLQRGGLPNAYDRILGIRMGLFAVDMVRKKKFGYATVLKGTRLAAVKLRDMLEQPRKVDENLFELTNFFS